MVTFYRLAKIQKLRPKRIIWMYRMIVTVRRIIIYAWSVVEKRLNQDQTKQSVKSFKVDRISLKTSVGLSKKSFKIIRKHWHFHNVGSRAHRSGEDWVDWRTCQKGSYSFQCVGIILRYPNMFCLKSPTEVGKNCKRTLIGKAWGVQNSKKIRVRNLRTSS